MGGGDNHRMGLYDMPLVKDNHILACGAITEAVEKIRQKNPEIFIEVETATLKEVEEALSCKVDRIMLEVKKIPQADIKKAIDMVRDSDHYRETGKPTLEASGEVTLETVAAIARTGVDYISVGELTHSVRALDINLKITENQKEPGSFPAADWEKRIQELISDAGISNESCDTTTGYYNATRFNKIKTINSAFVQFSPKPDFTLVEPGSGQGIFSICTAMLNPQAKIIGIESDRRLFKDSKKLLALAEKKGYIKKGQVVFYEGDFNARRFARFFRAADIIYYYEEGSGQKGKFLATLQENMQSGSIFVSYYDYAGWPGSQEKKYANISYLLDIKRFERIYETDKGETCL
jgi:hypothetical protein